MTRNLQQHIVGRELCRTVSVTEGEKEMNDNCTRYMKIRKRLFTEKSIAKLTIEKKVTFLWIFFVFESTEECMNYFSS